MGKITILAKFRVENNEHIIAKLEDSFLCESYRGFITLDDDNELYVSDPEYKKLCIAYKKAKELKQEHFKNKNK